jgi:hypothetical protein
MNRVFSTLLLLMSLASTALPVFAQEEEGPTVYVIQKGDTLWGLSDQFLKNPNYWPNLWSRNPDIGNPHFIEPGQKVRVFPDRIEFMEGGGAKEAAPTVVETPKAEPPPPPPPPPVAKEKSFMVTGSVGFLMEKEQAPVGYIVSTQMGRQIVGEDDIVYTDFGTQHGAKVGARFSIFKKLGPINHPINNVILGYKVIPLGSLQLADVEEKNSKAIIKKSYQEISTGAFLMPYHERRKEIVLKASQYDLTGYIVETETGKNAISAGDVAFLDLGSAHGLALGNMLYVVRDVVVDSKLAFEKIKLPPEVIGALVAVDVGEKTSTVLVVKSLDTIYRGDRVEMRKTVK